MHADEHDTIRVRGAHVNNLKGVDVDLPKRRITVCTGVSGSGKSSLVFGTIANESRRLIDETYPTFVQGFMEQRNRPEVDSLENLTPAIVVDQERIGANSRSTVGTATDALALLRILFSRLSEPHVGPSTAFSFNVASARGRGTLSVAKGNARAEVKEFTIVGGMCPACEGTGSSADIDLDLVVDRSRSLREGAILVPGFVVDGWLWRAYGDTGKLDPDKPVKDYSDKEWHWLMYQEPTKIKFEGINVTYLGLMVRVKQTYFGDREPKAPQAVRFKEAIATQTPCAECGGSRLNEAARTATVGGVTIAQCSSWEVTELLAWARGIDDASVAALVKGLVGILAAMVEVGLGYLSLNRTSGTLSGGEAQRVKMVRHLGSPLTDVTYVFDEPTAGLHPHDIARVNELLIQLRDTGNTVLVVEHKPPVIRIADHIVDMGPGAGEAGGTVVYSGPLEGLFGTDSLTAQLLGRRPTLRDEFRAASGQLEIRGANENNLKDVDVNIPLGVLVAVTGVAGSGKSSLIHGSLSGRGDVLIIDQSAIRGSRRSSPATYTGLLDPIRAAFAKANGVAASLFSPNSDGACPVCNGHGEILPESGVGEGYPCEVCGGRRFKPEVLEYRLDGLAIDQVLRLSVTEAAAHFTKGRPAQILQRLADVGLGYIRLGQPLSTLSGGERQRIKLASQLKEAPVIVLDEPSSGLHLADTELLVEMLQRLVADGTSVIVIEHNLAVICQADWIIDVGPGAGRSGGRIIFEGTPAQMVADSDTLTARYLKDATQ